MSLDAILPLNAGGKPPVADAREAKEWLTLLPLINVQQSRLELDELLGQLNTARIDGRELLKSLELLRDAVHTTQERLTAFYTGKPLPLSAEETGHWQAAQALWEKLETAYARCWRDAREDGSPLAELHALLAERTLRYGSCVARGYLLVYRPVPTEVWQRLFGRYRLIEDAGLAQTAVRDSLIDIQNSSMPQAMLIHALLLAASGTRQLTSRQLLWLDRRLEVLATRTSLSRQATALPGKTCLQIDLATPAPALRASKPLEGPEVREIDTLALAQVLTKRIKMLREGELPQKLGLGTELSPHATEALLTDLYRRWCELPTDVPVPANPAARHIPVGLELANLQRLIADGQLAPPPQDVTQLDRRALEALQLFGHTSASTQVAETPAGVAENWQLLRESAQEMQLARPVLASTRVGLQHLVSIAPGGQYLLGVTRTLEERDDQLAIGLRLLPGIPQAAMGRALDLVRAGQARYSEILLLPEMPQLKAQPSLILPTGWHRPSRLLEIWDGTTLTRVRLVQALERGANFERVLYAPAGSA